MKLLIIGASGLVGWNLYRVALSLQHDTFGTYNTFALPGLTHLDLDRAEDVCALVKQKQADAVVCCAAWSWVDGCETQPAKAFRFNRDQAATAARAARSVGAQFVYFSSSYIFDGRDGPYHEGATPNPISVYGQSKLAGEEIVQQTYSGNALVVRTMGVYGEEPQQKNFVYQVVRNLRANKPMKIPNDQIGNATFAPDIATGLLHLLEGRATGIWNLAGPNADLNRAEFAGRIAEEYRLPSELLSFVKTAELNQVARRPLHAGLRIDKMKSAYPWQSSSWQIIEQLARS